MIHLRTRLILAPLVMLAACSDAPADTSEAEEKQRDSVPSLGPQLASALPMLLVD